MSKRPIVWTGTVLPQWIDHNGHMNAGYYMVAFDEATGPWTAHCGLDAEYRRRNPYSTFSVEGHIVWRRELHERDPIRVEAQLLAFDGKKFHSYMELLHERKGFVAATHELLTMHIDMTQRRSAPFPEEILDSLGSLLQEHGRFGRPEEVGRVIRTKEGWQR